MYAINQYPETMRKITLTIFAAMLASAGATAQQCFPEWEFYRDITVDNTGNMDTLHNYAVMGDDEHRAAGYGWKAAGQRVGPSLF